MLRKPDPTLAPSWCPTEPSFPGMPRVVEWTTIVDGKSSCTLSKGKQLTFLNFMAMHDLHVEKILRLHSSLGFHGNTCKMTRQLKKTTPSLEDILNAGSYWRKSRNFPMFTIKMPHFSPVDNMYTSYIPLLFPVKSLYFHVFSASLYHKYGLICFSSSNDRQAFGSILTPWLEAAAASNLEVDSLELSMGMSTLDISGNQGKSPPTNQPKSW